MNHSTCSACGSALRVRDSFCDYSTTRGPLTAYDVVVCDPCGSMSLRRTAAQPSR